MAGRPDELLAVLDRMPESIGVYDLDARVRYVNPATERVFGKSLAEMRGRRLWDMFPDAIGNPFHQAFERVAAGGPMEVFDHYYAPFDRWFANRVERVGDRVHVVARDVTDDVRRRRRLEALARVSDVLSGDDLDPPAGLQAVAAGLADLLDADCSLALLSPDRAWLEIGASATRDPDVRTMIAAVRRWPAEDGHPGEALRTRTTVLANAEVESAAARVQDPAMRELVERYRPASVVVAPLVVGDEANGVLIASRRRGDRPLTSDDRTLLGEIAPGLALYLAHVRRREEARSLRHRLAAVSDSNPALVSFVDRLECYQYVNASYERWFGRPREWFLGRCLRDVLGPEGYGTIEPHVRRALGGTPVRFQAAIAYPPGARHVDAHYTPIRDAAGAVEGFAVTVLDVTAEVQLAEHERARLAVERRATRRLESLLTVTGRLAGASDADQIARVVVDEGVKAVEADLAAMWLLSTDRRELVLQRHRGFAPEQATAFSRLPVEGPGPVPDCVADGRPQWLDSRTAYSARYPEPGAERHPDSAPPRSVALLPLVIEGRAEGCINFTFHDQRRLTGDERTYLEVLASHAAEALRRARLYAELRDASETRQAMIQASPAAIMLLDRGGVVRAWNSAAERIFGWASDEVLGRALPTPGEDRRIEFLANLAHVLAGNVIDGRLTRRLRRSGEWFDVELYAAPIHLSDGRTMCLSMVFDVSERVRIEQGRRLIAEASAMLTQSLDWERTLAQVARLPLRDLADGCAVELRPGGGPPQRISAGLEPDDPAVRSTLSVPLTGGDRALGTLSVASRTRDFDALDRTLLVELASHAAAALENARLYQEARSARAEAEAANRAKDQFLAMLGHELRNPLAPITTALHLMRLRAPDVVERERAVIERQVGHLSRLVDDLLDVSRITRGKVELRRERTLVAAVIARAIEIASPLLEQRRHRLAIDVPPDLAVNGDPTRLGQVVANLLANAAKYTDVGGYIEVRAAGCGDKVSLLVRDNGIGIAPELLPVVFDLFVQGPQSSARTGGGLGLGLAIVRSLVELHGGSITARSEGSGKGTEVVVVLPAAAAPADAPPPAATPPGPRAGRPRRVLVVDDNEDAAAVLGDVLDAHGHQIRTAFDGPSALRIAEEFRPEVAVLDIGLPVMDGYELAQRLRMTLGLAPLRLIAVSGYGQDADRTRSREAGFDAHLAKPVAAETLMRLVDEPS